MNENLFAQTAQMELDAWENYKRRYEAQVPPPKKASLTIWQTVGWQLIVIGMQSFGAIGLAALRTAEMFYLASAGTNENTRRAEAVLAILAIEFGIVVFAAIRAEAKNRDLSDSEKLNAIQISTGWLVVGEVVMLAISVVAGLGVSAKGFNIEVDFGRPLAYTIGAGASIVAAVSGMVIGAMLARWNNVRDAAEIKYRKGYADWEQGLRVSWNSSPDKQIVENQLKLAKRALPRGIRSFDDNEQPKERRRQESEVYQKIWGYLAQHATDEFVPGPTEVSNALSVSKGYASDIIKEFRQQHFHTPQPAPQPSGND